MQLWFYFFAQAQRSSTISGVVAGGAPRASEMSLTSARVVETRESRDQSRQGPFLAAGVLTARLHTAYTSRTSSVLCTLSFAPQTPRPDRSGS